MRKDSWQTILVVPAKVNLPLLPLGSGTVRLRHRPRLGPVIAVLCQDSRWFVDSTGRWLSMATPTLPYIEQSQVFMRQAQEELQKGDLRQASEKGWGAAAQMIKAVAESRRWPHSEHRLLLGTVGRLVEETRDKELMMLFDSASELHRAFYEGHIGILGVDMRLRLVETLLERLRRFV